MFLLLLLLFESETGGYKQTDDGPAYIACLPAGRELTSVSNNGND